MPPVKFYDIMYNLFALYQENLEDQKFGYYNYLLIE